MKKVKYFYNPQSLRYEKIEISVWKFLLSIFGYVSAVVLTASILIILAYNYIDSPKEKQLKREIAQLEFVYEMLDKKLNQMEDVLAGLQDRDDNIYRVIFEVDPIPSSIRAAGMGGTNKYRELLRYDNGKLMAKTNARLDKISRQLYIQSRSYDDIHDMIKNKANLLASIPAIQPVSNKDLTRMASGFGYRIDPIYKVTKMHTGIDFTAPTGTDIYATGDGTVTTVEYSNSGYGNHIVIDHGYGYQTLYAHLHKFNVKTGQKVKRGDVIGTIGNTGKSTAPHLHYEVVKDGRKVDPINFFYMDLTPEEYEEIIKIAERHSQSFD